MASEINVTNDLMDVVENMEDVTVDVMEPGHNLMDIVIGVGIGLAVPVAIKTVKKGVNWIRDKFSNRDDIIEEFDDYDEDEGYEDEMRKAE